VFSYKYCKQRWDFLHVTGVYLWHSQKQAAMPQVASQATYSRHTGLMQPINGNTPQNQPNVCADWAKTLPPNYKLYAGGAYAGMKTDIVIDDSNDAASVFQVAVYETDQPIVLILSAYKPSIWRIKYVPGAKIAGIITSGAHKQIVDGAPIQTQIYDIGQGGQYNCGTAISGIKNNGPTLNHLSQTIFNRSPDQVLSTDNGFLTIGNASNQAQLFDGGTLSLPKHSFPSKQIGQGSPTSTQVPANALQQYHRSDLPRAGQQGLNDYLRQGKLRLMNQSDSQKWQALTGNTINSGPGRMVYVITGDITIPAGLYGANSVTFILGNGVPFPKGDLGHSALLDFNSGGCMGATCGMPSTQTSP
ncbi:hypothetical protein, partial [Stenoxybacter acetivorans]|uniref:hypothetical protein n=1 Tax=Stenoxybacter acetivorans TaxID=422441 RepID=UPI00056C9C57